MTLETRPSGRTARRAAPLGFLLLAGLLLWAAAHYRDLPHTEGATAYARDVSVSASAIYVTLRTLNAFLSSAQEVEVEGSVVFFGGSAQPLKVLEPIDDTVERIAGVVFAVMLASGVLVVSMGPLGAVGFALLAAAALGRAAVLASGRNIGGMPRHLAVYGGFLGIGIPFAFLLSGLVADALTERTWAEHSRIVAEITAPVESETVEEAEGSWRGAWGTMDQYRHIAGNLSSRADELVGSLVSLLAIFIVKILVLPVLLIGGLAVIARRLAGPDTLARRPG